MPAVVTNKKNFVKWIESISKKTKNKNRLKWVKIVNWKQVKLNNVMQKLNL